MGKNLQKVQNMLDGKGTGKIVVGNHSIKSTEIRKVGDKWTDADGYEWEQKEGYKMKLSTMPAVGLFSKVCKDCESPCVKSFDKETYVRNNRCYKCQTIWEEDLKYELKNKIGETGCKWTFWVRLQQLYQMDSIEKEMEQLIFTKHDENHSGKIFDESVVNAMANDNVASTIKVNKALTK
tara:strand:+ start:70 stop:609 length:540 start_codon:yes stop_codon:yes gene_type:complete